MLLLPPFKNRSRDSQLVQVLDRMRARAIKVRNARLCEWLVNRAFLNGVRQYSAVDYESGAVEWTYENQYSDLEFRNDELLRDYQIEMGRFLGIDVRPSVTMLGWGLDRLRAASIGQVVLDYQVDEAALSKVRAPFLEQLLQLGPSVLRANVRDAGALTGRGAIEVVAPWEILPIPFTAASPHQALGMMRDRLVPLEGLKRHSALADKLKGLDPIRDLEAKEVPWDEMAAASSRGDLDPAAVGVVDMATDAFQQTFESALEAPPGENIAKYREGRLVVRMTEYWLKTDDGLVRRYGVRVGRVVLSDTDYEKDGTSVWFPVGIARYYPVGFYGRGFVEPLRPFVQEAEKNLKAFWRMLRDTDSMGLLTIPTGLGIDDDAFRMDEYPRKVYYEPDPLLPDRTIGQIEPHNLGTMPRQGIDVAAGYMQKLAGQSPIFQGQSLGRVDSQAGMGFALETNNVGIEAPGQSIADAFTTVYAALLGAAKDGLTQQVLLQVLSLDTNVVGVVMDPDGTVSLDRNPVPLPNQVKINIKSRTPPSPAQQLQELRVNLQMGIITPLQFRLAVYRKGLPTDVANEAEYQSWRKIRYMVRVLFNDGETPQADILAADPMADNVEVCLEELGAFMATPEFSLAQGEVKDAFVALKDIYERMKGGYPPGMPYPDEIPTGRPTTQRASIGPPA